MIPISNLPKGMAEVIPTNVGSGVHGAPAGALGAEHGVRIVKLLAQRGRRGRLGLHVSLKHEVRNGPIERSALLQGHHLRVVYLNNS